MVQKSRAFSIWRRLLARFDLEGVHRPTTEPGVGTIVMPVTNVDVLLRTPTALIGTRSLIGTVADFQNYQTVPLGQRWHMVRAWKSSTTGNTQVMAIIGGVTVRLSINGTTQDAVDLNGVVLDQGDEIGLAETGNGADSAEDLHIVFDTEAAF